MAGYRKKKVPRRSAARHLLFSAIKLNDYTILTAKSPSVSAVPEFERFDSRHYRTVGVAEGYAAWHATYEATVLDAMDLALLARVESVDWANLSDVADLGCGTGRTAAWLVAISFFEMLHR